MSRRREAVRKALEWIEREQAVEHYEPLPGDPELPQCRPWIDDWQATWAATTLDVIAMVARQVGMKYYPGNQYMQDDLQGFLAVHAQTLANAYRPTWRADDPERYWAAYLTTALRARAKWHFASTIGTNNDDNRKAHKEMDRIEAMIDRATPAAQQRIPATMTPVLSWRPIGPEAFVMLTETLTDRLADPGAWEQPRDICLEPACLQSARREDGGKAGRCSHHYYEHTKAWGAAGAKTCIKPGCTEYGATRQMCPRHYQQWRAATNGPCSVDGCDRPFMTRGLCTAHYRQLRAREKSEAA